MNCTQCGKGLHLPSAIYLDAYTRNMGAFCDRACLRAWLGPDRPLSRRVEQAQNKALSPQHIVVDASKPCCGHRGLRYDCEHCRVILGEMGLV